MEALDKDGKGQFHSKSQHLRSSEKSQRKTVIESDRRLGYKFSDMICCCESEEWLENEVEEESDDKWWATYVKEPIMSK